MTAVIFRASDDQKARTKVEEGLRPLAYKDTVGVWTIGWGHAEKNPRPARGLRTVFEVDESGVIVRDAKGNGVPVLDEHGQPKKEFYQGRVCEGLEITVAEAERLFAEDMDETERGISALLRQELSQSQFDALVDFVHQYGLHNLDTSTLLTKINFNPFNPAVLAEFMRWTKAGGKHQEYVWRRSARRAIIYNGTPIPQKLWTKCAVVGGKPPLGRGFPFAVTADGDHIDYSITPTLQDLIDLGKAKAAPYKFDPKVETIVVETLPDSTPELDLAIFETGGGDTPTPPIQASTDASADVEAVRPAETLNQPLPAPASVSSEPEPLDLETPLPESTAASPAVELETAGVSRQSPATEEAVTPAPVDLPPPVVEKPVIRPPLALPKPPPPQNIDISNLNLNNIKVENGAKPMETSDRAMAVAVKAVGWFFVVQSRRAAAWAPAADAYFKFFGDPILAGAVISGGTWVLGKGLVKVGDFMREKFNKTATTLTY